MEKAIKNKVAKAVVPAIDVMFQALRSSEISSVLFDVTCLMIWSIITLFL